MGDRQAALRGFRLLCFGDTSRVDCQRRPVAEIDEVRRVADALVDERNDSGSGRFGHADFLAVTTMYPRYGTAFAIRGISHVILRTLAGRPTTRPMIARLCVKPSSAGNPRAVIISNGPISVKMSVRPPAR